MFHKKVCNILIVMVISLSLVAVSVTPPGLAQSQSNSASVKLYSSSEIPKSTKPQALPPSLPVYAIQSTHIDTDILLENTNLLDRVNATVVVSETLDSGIDHLFATNPITGTIFDQYNHTGGLFAVNYSQAYTETMPAANPSNNVICAFLAGSQLFPSEIEPPVYCQANPPGNRKPVFWGACRVNYWRIGASPPGNQYRSGCVPLYTYGRARWSPVIITGWGSGHAITG